MRTTPTISEQDLLWLRDRAVGSTGFSVLIADARLPDMPLVDVNPAFERMTGYSSRDVLGKNCRFLQGPGTDRDVVTGMRSAIDEERHFNEVILNYRRDGTPFWNEVNVSPVYDQTGGLTHFVSVQQDVTQRERANQHLQLVAETSEVIMGGDTSEEIVKTVARLLVHRLADYCTTHLRSEDGTISWLSTTGTDKELSSRIEQFERSTPHQSDGDSGIAIVMRTGRSILHPVSSGEMLDQTARTEAHREFLQSHDWRATMIVPIMAFDHVFGTIHLSRAGSGFPFTDEDVALVRDIGNRVGSIFQNTRLMKREKSALAAREQFLSIAAHELRTPVASITGYAQLLSRSLDRGTLTQDRLRQAIRTVDASVKRLSSLTDDLLDMSQRGLEETPLRIDTIYTESFLASMVTRSALLYDHPFVIDNSAAAEQFEGDVARIEQVMSNLISNAARYSDSDQPITIDAKSDSNGVRITVNDLGLGLAAEELESIFELFGKSAHPDSETVSGLGLFISRNIVERHGGKVWVESAGRGHGSSINVWLPARSPASVPSQSQFSAANVETRTEAGEQTFGNR